MKYVGARRGFTLIELLIVISIIGILAVALLPTVTNAPKKARDASRKADINKILTAVEQYNADKGSYPDTFCTATIAADSPVLAYFSGGTAPKDPTPGNVVGDCSGGYKFCRKNGDRYSYVIAAKMEDKKSNNATETDLANCGPDQPFTMPSPAPQNPTIYLMAQ